MWGQLKVVIVGVGETKKCGVGDKNARSSGVGYTTKSCASDVWVQLIRRFLDKKTAN